MSNILEIHWNLILLTARFPLTINVTLHNLYVRSSLEEFLLQASNLAVKNAIYGHFGYILSIFEKLINYLSNNQIWEVTFMF